ncbi:hypothetical protein SAMN02745129_0998 [Ferrimonas marina]|uniref:Uncharacterized protein n=1 Tax=Ferrimonas marina TaxID=299255 RepID=A0A1M5NDU1_9GAMM|nr:hypothetical protein SAMN02745129_0998 [Ferrimonas marina]
MRLPFGARPPTRFCLIAFGASWLAWAGGSLLGLPNHVTTLLVALGPTLAALLTPLSGFSLSALVQCNRATWLSLLSLPLCAGLGLAVAARQPTAIGFGC